MASLSPDATSGWVGDASLKKIAANAMANMPMKSVRGTLRSERLLVGI